MTVLPRPLSPGAGMQVTTERLFARQWMPSVHPGMAFSFVLADRMLVTELGQRSEQVGTEDHDWHVVRG